MCLQLNLRVLTPPSGCGVAVREDLMGVLMVPRNVKALHSAVTGSASVPMVMEGHFVIGPSAPGTVALKRAEVSATR